MGFTHEVKKIDRVEYALHRKDGSPDSVRVTYVCGLTAVREWVCIEHRGYAQQKAFEWWEARVPGAPFPSSSAEAILLLHTNPPAVPTKLKLKIGGKFPEIERFFFDDNNNRIAGAKNHSNLYGERTEASGRAAAAH